MISTKSKTANSSAPKRGLPFNIAFKPNFGASIRPIGESTRVFVNLIGTLFAMNGLFPKDHPAFAPNSTAPLSLFEVISTAWGNLTFTEKDMPKTLFFFAAVSCMVITTLAIVIGLFSLFVGSAHAQSAFFTPPANDLAQNWIDYLFKGTPLVTTYDQAGSNVQNVTQTSNINIQCSMMTALGFYSDAVLMVAALILFYHLAWMVVETAHHGSVMGKRGNQVWAPIRLVVAVGLLVPIGNNGPANCSATSGAGLNSAQYITIKIAELGSALASNVWIKFINAMTGAQYGFVPPPVPEVDRIVAALFVSEGCMAAWDYHMQTILTPPGSPNFIYAPTPVTDGNGTRYDYGSAVEDEQDVCGSVNVPIPPKVSSSNGNGNALTGQVPPQTAVFQAIYQAHNDTLQQMMPVIRNMASADVVYQIPSWNEQVNGGIAAPNNQDFQNAVQQYYNTLKGNLQGAYNNIQDSLKTEAFTTTGWIAAGTWMNTIARDQFNIANAVYDGIPTTQFPTLGDVETSVSKETSEGLANFAKWIGKGYAPGQAAAVSPCDLQNGALGANAGKRQVNQDESSPFNMLMQFIDKTAVAYQLWPGDEGYNTTCTSGALFTIGTQFQSNNPFGELTALGQRSMHIASEVVNIMFYIAVGRAGAEFAKGFIGQKDDTLAQTEKNWQTALKDSLGSFAGLVSALGSMAIPLLGFLAVAFITIGITLGFILPLIPFMHFFFSAVAWGLVLLEGVIAMPLVALAHLNPEGDGLPGNMARQAYFMLLGLFMRPAMIIFAFIASLLIFFLSMFLLNKLFAVTVIGTQGVDYGLATFSRIIYTVLYVFLAYTCAVNCFKIIDSLPEAVFKWINVSLGHQQIASGSNTLQNAGSIVTGVASSQGMTAFQQAGDGLGKLGGDAGGMLKNLPNFGKSGGGGNKP